MKKAAIALLPVLFTLAACSPEVGSKGWCDDMEEKPKGDWTANETGSYTKHCLFRSDDEK